MPTKVVDVKRWEVAVGVALYLVILAGTLTYMQRSIDEAERRITQNAVLNAAQDEVRRQLVDHFRETDMQTCRQIEGLKAEFRNQAVENYANLERNAELLGIVLTPQLRHQAEVDRNRTLDRFAARDCNR